MKTLLIKIFKKEKKVKNKHNTTCSQLFFVLFFLKLMNYNEF